MIAVLDEFGPMKVKQIRPGAGSLFTIDLDARDRAAKYLWIYLCGWAIVSKQFSGIDSESPKIAIDDFLLKRWHPHELIYSTINRNLEMDFVFDNSKLRLFPYPKTYGAHADMFRLFDGTRMYSLRYEDGEIKERSAIEYGEDHTSISS